MAITYKEIAEIVGVSRGTVDRAIHNRGRVSPEVKQRILEVAQEYGFTPSPVGRALARAKNPIKIGVVVHLAKIPFFKQVIDGVYKAKGQLANLGGEVLVRELPGLDPEKQLQAVNELVEEGIRGLAITPAEDDALRARLNELQEKGLPIITFNTDMAGLERLCFVGMDNIRAGQTAAGLMNMLLGENGGQVLIISGHITNQANSSRVDGFVKEIAKNFSAIKVPSIQFSLDDEKVAYDITMAALRGKPQIKGIFMPAGGQAGVCRALEECGLAGKIKLIVFDILPETIHYIQKGTIHFIIDQNAAAQGNRPPRILFDYLLDNKQPETLHILSDISIKTAYNI